MSEQVSYSLSGTRGTADDQATDDELVDEVNHGGNEVLEDSDQLLVDLVEVELVAEEWDVEWV